MSINDKEMNMFLLEKENENNEIEVFILQF